MNELQLKPTLPELGFILKEHRENFVKRVIETYQYTTKRLNTIPNISDNLFMYVMHEDSEAFIAAFLCAKKEDSNYFQYETSMMTEQERYSFMTREAELYNMKQDYEYDTAFYHDIKTVLQFYNMSFIDILDTSNQIRTDDGFYFVNLPSVQVW
ncbi:hypothetical protein ACQKJG_18830 [Priestia megaterium]|uniref:hypothetical protein n=1 Tax=Priestia megaterium TaxID=1404 RepID=UPI003D031E20